jgi:uncharacterized protein
MTYRRPQTHHSRSAPVIGAVLTIALLSLVAVCPVALARNGEFPRPIGYVSDFAGFISSGAERLIEGMAAEVREKTGAEMAIVTIRTTEGRDIEEYAVDLFMDWGIGQRGEDNGLLVLVAVNDRQMWIKPGYGLEGAVPDAFAHSIYYDVLRPAFRANQQDAGLVQATRMLAERIVAEYGQTLAYSDTLEVRMAGELNRRTQVTGRRALSMMLSALFPFLVFILIVVMSVRRGLRGGRGFWMGGAGRGGGSFGGFGGGFGGFGGGSAGGAGAGGGW